MRVFVLGKNKQPLMPCLQARARELLNKGQAAVYRLYPFTIILLDRKEGNCQESEFKIDPGSKKTGLAIVCSFQNSKQVVWAAHLEHRGEKIKGVLETRRALRRGRRSRKTCYRSPRFENRRIKPGWFPPSLQSRINQTTHWAKKLSACVPFSKIAVETVKFDTQKMQNPEISSQGIHAKYCRLVQRTEGYMYTILKAQKNNLKTEAALPPPTEVAGFRAGNSMKTHPDRRRPI